MKQELHPGYVEEVEIKLIRSSPRPVRKNLGYVGDLAASISEKGLLEPIVIRPLEDRFEIIAGNRRLAACKSLGMRKVPCHILNFNEKEAYEASLIENLQHKTLDAVEEARAFQPYVEDYGYGGVSELARRIGMSEQYVSQRLKLLTLPKDVLEQVTGRLVSPSQASELLGLDERDQRMISDLVVRNKIPSKVVRKLAKEVKSYQDPFSAPDPQRSDVRPVQKALNKCILLLRTALIRLDDILGHLDESNWIEREELLCDRAMIHGQIDRLIRLRIKLNRAEYVKAF